MDFSVNLRAKWTSNLRVKMYHLWDVKHHQSGNTAKHIGPEGAWLA